VVIESTMFRCPENNITVSVIDISVRVNRISILKKSKNVDTEYEYKSVSEKPRINVIQSIHRYVYGMEKMISCRFIYIYIYIYIYSLKNGCIYIYTSFHRLTAELIDYSL
jgi:hypothetical protein